MKPKGGIINMLRSGALTRDDAGYGILLLALSVLCFVAPLLNDAGPIPLVGLLMVVAGVVSLFHSLRRAAGSSFRSTYGTGGLTLLIGILLLAAPAFAGGALRIFVGAVFLVDGVRRGIDIFRKGQEQERWRNILAGLANLVVALVVFLPTQQSLVWTIAIAGGLRILGTAWDLVTAAVYGTADAGGTVLRDLGIADDPGVHVAVNGMVAEEQARRPVDLAWILTLILTLMAIHIGRMESEWTLAGLLSPLVALIGDLFVALVAAFLIIVPLRLFFAKATRGTCAKTVGVDDGESCPDRTPGSCASARAMVAQSAAAICRAHTSGALFDWGRVGEGAHNRSARCGNADRDRSDLGDELVL